MTPVAVRIPDARLIGPVLDDLIPNVVGRERRVIDGDEVAEDAELEEGDRQYQQRQRDEQQLASGGSHDAGATGAHR